MRLLYFVLFLSLISCNSKTEIVEKFANGKPKRTIEYFDNDSTCEKLYHENGNLKEVKSFKNGKQTGEEIRYREDGKKSSLVTFKGGIRDGQTYEYHPSGQIAFEGVVINGEFEGISKIYFKNGKLADIWNRHLGKDTGWGYSFNMQGDTIKREYTKSVNDTSQYFDGKGKKITAEEWGNIKREW